MRAGLALIKTYTMRGATYEVDCHLVTRRNDEPNGLPFTRIGNRILIHVPTASEWIFGRMRRPNPQRHRRRRPASV
jgi:hypothetical protein